MASLYLNYMHTLPGAKCVFGLSEVETTPKDDYQVRLREWRKLAIRVPINPTPLKFYLENIFFLKLHVVPALDSDKRLKIWAFQVIEYHQAMPRKELWRYMIGDENYVTKFGELPPSLSFAGIEISYKN